jgi:hypothetical protein
MHMIDTGTLFSYLGSVWRNDAVIREIFIIVNSIFSCSAKPRSAGYLLKFLSSCWRFFLSFHKPVATISLPDLTFSQDGRKSASWYQGCQIRYVFALTSLRRSISGSWMEMSQVIRSSGNHIILPVPDRRGQNIKMWRASRSQKPQAFAQIPSFANYQTAFSADVCGLFLYWLHARQGLLRVAAFDHCFTTFLALQFLLIAQPALSRLAQKRKLEQTHRRLATTSHLYVLALSVWDCKNVNLSRLVLFSNPDQLSPIFWS